MIAGAIREEILGRYARLQEVAPEAFDLTAVRDRKEPIIIDSLLEQTDGVTRQCIHRLYAAGVNRLGAYYQATVDELSSASGVGRETCEKILARFSEYRRRRAEASPGEDGTADRARLASVMQDLQRADEQFRDVDEDTQRSRRRALRGERQALVREVDIVLAQLGELDLIEKLRRFPVERKIQRIQRYLRQPRSK
jgi:hypothetical protein